MRRVSRLPRPRVPGVETTTAPGGAGVRVYRPPLLIGRQPALLWMHGGGYVMGDATLDDRTCRRFADVLGITVASVDYRLAPEHPYPAALHDCHAALRWLAQQPGVDAGRIAVGGMSAGGGLAAALALHMRDHDDIPVVHQLLVYPMLDNRPAIRTSEDRYIRLWNRKSNDFAWRAYLADADPRLAVPARCTDLTNLPPAWIGVGTLDLLHDQDVHYAHRLRAAGVACELLEIEGAFHGFDTIRPKTTVAQQFMSSQLNSLRNAFQGA